MRTATGTLHWTPPPDLFRVTSNNNNGHNNNISGNSNTSSGNNHNHSRGPEIGLGRGVGGTVL